MSHHLSNLTTFRVPVDTESKTPISSSMNNNFSDEFDEVLDIYRKTGEITKTYNCMLTYRLQHGFIGTICGMRCFISGDNLGYNDVSRYDEHIGKTFEVAIINKNYRQSNYVVSHTIVFKNKYKHVFDFGGPFIIGKAHYLGVIKNINQRGVYIYMNNDTYGLMYNDNMNPMTS